MLICVLILVSKPNNQIALVEFLTGFSCCFASVSTESRIVSDVRYRHYYSVIIGNSQGGLPIKNLHSLTFNRYWLCQIRREIFAPQTARYSAMGDPRTDMKGVNQYQSKDPDKPNILTRVRLGIISVQAFERAEYLHASGLGYPRF